MSSRGWGNKSWSKSTKERRLKIARDAMDAIDKKFEDKEAESYLDPDKRYIEYNTAKFEGAEGALKDGDAIVGLTGDFDWLSMEFECPVGLATAGVVAVDAPADAVAAAGPFRSLEHAFQALRAGADAAAVAGIRAAKTAREAKSIGAKAFRGRQDGDAFREKSVGFMEALLRDKFLRSPELREKLLATEERRILHVNDFNDGFWGLRSKDRSGKNELGKALSRLRRDLREADTHDDGRDVARWCEDRVPPGLDKRDAAFDVAWRRSGAEGLARLPTYEEHTVMIAGRHDRAGLRVDHGSTSRFHCCFANCAPADDDTCAIVCLAAQHGTWVHRRGAEPSRLKPFVFYHLLKKDEVRFGESTRRFRVIADRRLRSRKRDRLLLKMTEKPADDDEEARTVRVTSLAYEADEDDLRGLFKHIAGVKVQIQYESASSRRHRGLAFALMPNLQAMTAALACDGDEVKGRKVRVFRADAPPPEKRPRRD